MSDEIQEVKNSNLVMNNYVLRRVAYALSLNHTNLLSIFALADYSLQKPELESFLKKDDQEGFVKLKDYLLVIFLDGLIIKQRGKREDAPNMSQVERVELSKKAKMDNNVLLMKLKIAFNLKADELIKILNNADFRVSKGELSAFSRRSEHRNYRPCGNQLIRNLLTGLTLEFRSGDLKNES